MKMYAIIGALAVALLLMGKLYMNESNALAVEEQRTQGLVASYEMLTEKYRADQQKIVERDQAYAELNQVNEGLKDALDTKIKSDPASQQWTAAAVPASIREFVQQSQRAAIGMSGAGSGPDRTEPDTSRGSGNQRGPDRSLYKNPGSPGAV